MSMAQDFTGVHMGEVSSFCIEVKNIQTFREQSRTYPQDTTHRSLERERKEESDGNMFGEILT
jgi:hypothetical protein